MRRCTMAVALALALPLLFVDGPAAEDAARCAGRRLEVSLATVDASAGIVANALGKRDSMRSVASRLLTEATHAARATDPPGGGCPEDCRPAEPDVVLRSAPIAFLSDSPDAAHCGALHERTTADPLVYERSFASLDEVSDWINALARGNGPDGEDLYRRCDRTCSPQYAWTIRSAGTEDLAVRAEVVCGPARDRSDNAYRLATGLAWSCGAY